jgi:hypothetical protein
MAVIVIYTQRLMKMTLIQQKELINLFHQELKHGLTKYNSINCNKEDRF